MVASYSLFQMAHISQITSTNDSLLDSWSNISSTHYENFDFSRSHIIYDITEEELGLSEELNVFDEAQQEQHLNLAS